MKNNNIEKKIKKDNYYEKLKSLNVKLLDGEFN
jgi:hypothetical protein